MTSVNWYTKKNMNWKWRYDTKIPFFPFYKNTSRLKRNTRYAAPKISVAPISGSFIEGRNRCVTHTMEQLERKAFNVCYRAVFCVTSVTHVYK
jgi:hypothetical protein